MFKLLSVDLKRIFKDKLFLVICIIGGVFAVFTPLLYKLLFGSIEDAEILNEICSSKILLFSSFSLSNNFGIILPVFLMIIVFKDFSQGTIRNKIICGYSRQNIFLSIFSSISVVMVLSLFIYAFINFGVASIFFNYSNVPFSLSEFGYLIASLAFDFICILFVSALIAFICVFSKNAGVSIVLYMVVVLGSTILISILIIYVTLFSFDSGHETSVKIINFLINCNVLNNLSTIGLGTSYTLKDSLYIILSSLVGIIACVFGGIFIFKKKDIN